jgi:hypothetical protein
MVAKLKIGALLAATVASVTAGTLVGQPAFASNPDVIANYGSGLCLQPVPDSFQNIVDDGVRIAQEPCNSSQEQKWQSLQVGSSGGQPTYYLINQRSGKCLDVTDANTNDRAPIQQWTCNGGGSEMWIAKAYSFGRRQYVNSRTSKCLDIPNGSTSPGYIWQYRCTTNNTSQAFTFPS